MGAIQKPWVSRIGLALLATAIASIYLIAKIHAGWAFHSLDWLAAAIAFLPAIAVSVVLFMMLTQPLVLIIRAKKQRSQGREEEQ